MIAFCSFHAKQQWVKTCHTAGSILDSYYFIYSFDVFAGYVFFLSKVCFLVCLLVDIDGFTMFYSDFSILDSYQ